MAKPLFHTAFSFYVTSKPPHGNFSAAAQVNNIYDSKFFLRIATLLVSFARTIFVLPTFNDNLFISNRLFKLCDLSQKML